MYVMVTFTYPAHRLAEVNKIARELEDNPPPSFVKRVNVFIRSDLKYGRKGWAIYNIEKGKEEEGLLAIEQRVGKSDNIEGYKWDMQIVGSIPERMAAHAGQTG